MDTEEQISAFVWIQVAVIGLSQVILVAFVLGFFLGHFTYDKKTVTVTAQEVAMTEEKEAKEEEAAPAEAHQRAEEEQAAHLQQVEMRKAEREGEAAAKETAAAKEAEEAEGGGSESEGGGGEAALTAGKEVFTSNCGSCHTLAEAGTSGEVGPNLDELMPEQSLVETQVTNGGGGMPAFGGQLSEEEIKSVAEYVSTVAGSE
jgi:mono/diheme cytochrome c family protein